MKKKPTGFEEIGRIVNIEDPNASKQQLLTTTFGQNIQFFSFLFFFSDFFSFSFNKEKKLYIINVKK